MIMMFDLMIIKIDLMEMCDGGFPLLLASLLPMVLTKMMRLMEMNSVMF